MFDDPDPDSREVHLRARGVASVFMTDDALGAFWSGAWLGSHQVGPSSLLLEVELSPTQLDSENCGQVGGEQPGTAERAALLANNNPTMEPPNGPNETWMVQMKMDKSGWN